MNIKGLIIPAATPFNDGHVDLPALSNLLEFLIKGGADSIFIIGTTGEFQYLSFTQKQKIIKQANSIIGHRLPLLVGISAEDPAEIKALAGEAAENEAEGVVLAPIFGGGNPCEKMDSMIQNSSLPLLLYNNPEIHPGKQLPLKIVGEYAPHPKVIGIKDSSGDRDYFNKLLQIQSKSFSVLEGKESSILSAIVAGADGIVPGTANVDPGLFARILVLRDEETMGQILFLKSELKELTGEPIPAIKQKLVQLGIISSAETVKL
ncbi:MAG: dihydrodipicolinate synthase family protein [Dehalococcoidia bacterium]